MINRIAYWLLATNSLGVSPLFRLQILGPPQPKMTTRTQSIVELGVYVVLVEFGRRALR